MSTPVQKRFDELWAERSTRLWSTPEIEELLGLVRAGAECPAPSVDITISGSPSPETAKAIGEMIGLVAAQVPAPTLIDHAEPRVSEFMRKEHVAYDRLWMEFANQLCRELGAGHIGGVNKMVGETPVTDAECCHPHNLCLENSRAEYAGRHDEIVDSVVPAAVARKLEKELARYKAAEAEEARIQKQLDEEHARIETKTKEEVIEDLRKDGYSREELDEMAVSMKAAIDWYMSEPADKRGWLFAFKAGRKSVIESKGETS